MDNMNQRATGAFERVEATVEHGITRVENRWCPNKNLTLTIVWLLIQLFAILLVIAGFSVGTGENNPSYVFMGIFVAVLAFGLLVVGTVIMRKYRTPQHHGFLLGLSFMMSMIMLQAAVASGARIAELRESGEFKAHAEAAVCAFSIFLFVLYLSFTVCFYRWRDIVLDFDDLYDEDIAEANDDHVIEQHGDDEPLEDLKQV